MCNNLVSGNEHEQATDVNAKSLIDQPVENQTSQADDSTLSASSSIQETPTQSSPSSSSEALMSAKECEEIIGQYFASDKKLHNYHTCPSKHCYSLSFEEIARLKQQKEKIHSQLAPREGELVAMLRRRQRKVLLSKQPKTKKNQLSLKHQVQDKSMMPLRHTVILIDIGKQPVKNFCSACLSSTKKWLKEKKLTKMFWKKPLQLPTFWERSMLQTESFFT